MCGIAGGVWRPADDRASERINRAINQLRNRGPDDRGTFFTNINGGQLALAQTRLSIIDLSSAGHQPMQSPDGRYTIVYNGEVYNYRELRQELIRAGCRFESDSDTEVLLQSWIHWNTECLRKIEGMFAFVVYDNHLETLTCARDAFGIKPFYYSESETGFIFASDVPAILELYDSTPSLDWQRCYDYLVNGDYDSQERTFFSGLKHLLPGHLLEFDLASNRVGRLVCWWEASIKQRSDLSFEDAADLVRQKFLHNVNIHLRSDVPLGSALSGGIDSSSVVCAIRHLEPDCLINTFSFIAKDYDISEEHWVDMVNDHTGARGHKVISGGVDLGNDLEDMIRAQGEPFGSTSIYAQYKVFQLARDSGVTVTLDGQGADEMLAGYTRYPGVRMLSLFESGDILGALNFSRNWSQWPGRSFARTWMYFFAAATPAWLYPFAKKITGRDPAPDWLDYSALIDSGVEVGSNKPAARDHLRGRRLVAELKSNLSQTGLPSLLRHGDRNSMRFSIESRVPFLTIPMVELLLGLPEEYLISPEGETKSVFRAAMRGIVPDEILERKDKIGFATPEKDWLLGLQDKARNWLTQADSIPFINREAMIRDFDQIMAGNKPFSWQVWRWVNFVKWHEIYG